MLSKITIIALYIFCLLSACNGPDKKAGEITLSNSQQTAGNNSAAFNQSFEKLLISYYALKDAMVEYDTAVANASARQIAGYANGLQTDSIKSDAAGNALETAKNYTGTISSAANGLLKKNTIPEMKKEFQVISDAMYGLAGTVKYDRQKIYHQRCPMAFNDDTEAFWLSNNSKIVNPYLGRKHPKYRDAMLECGEVTDSLGFSKD